MRVSTNNNSYISFTVAVNIRSSNGQQDANFYSVRAFRQVETMQKYLSKGRKVAVVGSLTLRLYDANDGTKRIAADVLADDVQFLPSAPPGEGGGSYAPRAAESTPPFGASGSENGFSQVDDDDDLPF